MYQPTILTDDHLRRLAPSIFATEPAEECSDRYHFAPTIEIVNGLRDAGWNPVSAEQVQARTKSGHLFGKHMIKFEHPDIEPINGTKVQSILINSHNRAAAFQFLLGLIEFACSNGLITGDLFNRISIRHNSNAIDGCIDACTQIGNEAPNVMGKVAEFKDIILTPDERMIFARSALNFRYGAHGSAEEKPLVIYGSPRRIQLAEQDVEGTDKTVQYIPFRPDQMLDIRRPEDRNDSLWTTYNVIQENLIKGGASGLTEKYRRTTMRPIKAIDENVKLNKALWSMAQYLADHKKSN